MDRRKRLALIAAIMGSFVAGLDATAVNVALPAIRGDLGGRARGSAVGVQRLPVDPRVSHPGSGARWATCSGSGGCSRSVSAASG